MENIVPFFLGGLFGLLSAIPLGYLLLRLLFRFRRLPSDNLQTFYRASGIGMLVLFPPLFFVGFVLFSMMIKGASIDIVQLSGESQRLFAALIVLGVLAQLFLGQRLSLVSGERLIVERIFSGTVYNLSRGEISTIGIYKRIFDHPHARIQLNLKDGRILRLFFGEQIRPELTSWLNQN